MPNRDGMGPLREGSKLGRGLGRSGKSIIPNCNNRGEDDSSNFNNCGRRRNRNRHDTIINRLETLEQIVLNKD